MATSETSLCENCATNHSAEDSNLCQPCLDDEQGVECPECSSRRTHEINSWTGRQQTTGPRVTIEQWGCAGCGNNWTH